MVVLVTGASGQLGESIQFISKHCPEIAFRFFSSSELNILDIEAVANIFESVKPDYCINTAAYTAVDKAELEPEKAYAVNVTGVKNLAETCKKNNTILLHISTDFVFDGSKTTPYKESDPTNPQGVYGKTKLEGERVIETILQNYFIIRTSWVYSEFGHNFMKTMLRIGREKNQLSIVNDQIGTPTNAIDLAEALVKIILFAERDKSIFESQFKILNFSNEGQCSWYDFARKIFEINNIQVNLQPISSEEYPTAAKRPSYSVLDKSKIKEIFGFEIKDWEERLKL